MLSSHNFSLSFFIFFYLFFFKFVHGGWWLLLLSCLQNGLYFAFLLLLLLSFIFISSRLVMSVSALSSLCCHGFGFTLPLLWPMSLFLSLSLSHACPCCYIAADHWSIAPYTTSSSSSVFIDLHCTRVPLLFPAQKKKGKVSPRRAHFTYICVNKLKQIIIPLLPPKNMQHTRAVPVCHIKWYEVSD